MKTAFRITGIDHDYQELFRLNQEELTKMGAVKMVADQEPGFPCRVSLEDAKVGEEVLLFQYEHHKAHSPYRASGPIFIRKHAKSAQLETNEIPKMVEHRHLSLRAYDQNGMMLQAETLHGERLRDTIEAIFANQEATYIQVHNAGPGCYNCQVNRVWFWPSSI